MDYKLITEPSQGVSVTEQIFLNRGFSSKREIEHYLHTTDEDIHSPLLLQNMRRGAEILVQHIHAGSKTKIIVDPDCDGFTSAAALINYLNSIAPYFTQNKITYALQNDKAHGIILSAIEEDVKLVIAPDSSSNEADIHKALQNKGIDVLVLDHHNADELSPYACIINNHTCEYPNKTLSGVGIVYKFCQYIDSLLGLQEADKLLDLVALGMIADMMDLRDCETRRLIEKGLINLHNPFIKMMVAKNEFSLKGKLTPIGVAFYIAPSVNAVSRVGTVEDKQLLFESLLEHKAFEFIPSTKRGCAGQSETRVEQSVRTCMNLKSKQNRKRDEALEKIDAYIQKHHLLDNKLLLVCLPEELEIHPNLTGLVANSLANKYQHPTVLLNHYVDDEGVIIWKGSGRNCGGTDFTNLQQLLLDSECVQLAQGHAEALGVHVLDVQIDNLIAYTNEKLANYTFKPLYNVDFVFTPLTLNGNDILQIASLAPYWGQEMPEPWIAIKGLRLNSGNLDLLKETTIKITLDNNISLIMFKQNIEVFESLYSDFGQVTIDLVGRCKCNDWDGSPQIEIKEFEIVDRQELYF